MVLWLFFPLGMICLGRTAHSNQTQEQTSTTTQRPFRGRGLSLGPKGILEQFVCDGECDLSKMVPVACALHSGMPVSRFQLNNNHFFSAGSGTSFHLASGQ